MPRFFIDSLDDPRLDKYRELKLNNVTRDEGVLIAEGSRVVERLIESDFPVESVLITEKKLSKHEYLIAPDLNVFVVPHELAHKLVGFNFHTGIIACGRRKPCPRLDDFCVPTPSSQILAACSGIDDPDNLGVIIRLCRAFGIGGLLLGDGCTNPYSRRVLRVSMSNSLFLPIRETKDFIGELQQLRDKWQFDLAATVLSENAESLDSASRSERTVLVFGNEAHGLDQSVIDVCNRQMTIPMRQGTDSLNVSIAAGIFLYEFTKSGKVHAEGSEVVVDNPIPKL